jgi:TatD DNase family protein
MIDIGVNLTNSQFSKDWKNVIDSAIKADVEIMIITGTCLQQSLRAHKMTLDYPGVLYSTAGIHPHDAKTFDQQSIEQLRTLAGNKQVVAIGECGLDFNRNYSSRSEQLQCFEAQLQLAVDLKLPVFLHQRSAWKEYIELLSKYRKQLVGAVAHCFTESKTELEDLLDLDLHIGITGWICDERRGKELRESVSMIPLDRIMIETDAPYLLPHDLKSVKKGCKKLHRNEPQYLLHIVNVLAKYMGIEVQQLINATTTNTRLFFRL